MKKFSIEILPKQKDKIPDINKKYFNDVYITHIPGSPLKDLIDTSEAVLNNNLNPVPHLPARSMESENDLNFLLNKLTKLGVSDILMIGGFLQLKSQSLYRLGFLIIRSTTDINRRTVAKIRRCLRLFFDL